jgi:hypothetical protein
MLFERTERATCCSTRVQHNCAANCGKKVSADSHVFDLHLWGAARCALATACTCAANQDRRAWAYEVVIEKRRAVEARCKATAVGSTAGTTRRWRGNQPAPIRPCQRECAQFESLRTSCRSRVLELKLRIDIRYERRFCHHLGALPLPRGGAERGPTQNNRQSGAKIARQLKATAQCECQVRLRERTARRSASAMDGAPQSPTYAADGARDLCRLFEQARDALLGVHVAARVVAHGLHHLRAGDGALQLATRRGGLRRAGTEISGRRKNTKTSGVFRLWAGIAVTALAAAANARQHERDRREAAPPAAHQPPDFEGCMRPQSGMLCMPRAHLHHDFVVVRCG